MVSFKSLKKVGVIGLMSGTSLDGLDLCFVEFSNGGGQWKFEIIVSKSLSYSSEWQERLQKAFFQDSIGLALLEKEYGDYLGLETIKFMQEHDLTDQVHLIASHGHTVFHQPEKGITVQVGKGDRIAKHTQKPVVSNFRIKDVELGGQGAPLVPVGDEYLFAEYDACLNLGGISNISFKNKNERIAFDIAPCNLPLNKIAREDYKMEYDKDGAIARSGKCVTDLLDRLNSLAYYHMAPPKSLAIEWLNHHFYPIIEKYMNAGVTAADIMHTIIVHETSEIAAVINKRGLESALVTGGGAFNSFFMAQLREKTNSEIVIPSDEIVEFKEALIFAFLGLLNVLGIANTYKSVTGATRDSIGGFVTYP